MMRDEQAIRSAQKPTADELAFHQAQEDARVLSELRARNDEERDMRMEKRNRERQEEEARLRAKEV